jgi:tRNA threonylcarbamoyl adenosine modification protein YjeE
LALVISPGDRVFLEGEMGAGKTTFARSLLSGLGVVQPAEGSPSFAIAHEYRSPRTDVVHIDFYRLKSEVEIQDAGIDTYFWERPQSIIICEWISLFPALEQSVQKVQSVWRVKLENKGSRIDARNIEITKPARSNQGS